MIKDSMVLQIGTPPGAVDRLAENQPEYQVLPVKRIQIADPVDDSKLADAMESHWYPTFEAMRAIVDGAPVVLRTLGTVHPPVLIYVGDKDGTKD